MNEFNMYNLGSYAILKHFDEHGIEYKIMYHLLFNYRIYRTQLYLGIEV